MNRKLRKHLNKALSPLVGLELSAFGRAADLLWVHFGKMRRVPAWKKGWKEVGEYALHIQCPWRLVHGSTIVVGRGDIFEQRAKSKAVLFDSRIRKVPLRTPRLKAVRVLAEDVGGFSLELSRGWTLEVFPMDSSKDDSEWWRLFRPGNTAEHVVVSGSGIGGA